MPPVNQTEALPRYPHTNLQPTSSTTLDNGLYTVFPATTASTGSKNVSNMLTLSYRTLRASSMIAISRKLPLIKDDKPGEERKGLKTTKLMRM